MKRITVRESSTTQLTADDHNALEGSREVGVLIEQGIVSLVRTRAAPFGLKAYGYVGSCTIASDRQLVIIPKSSDAFCALLHWSLPEDIRTADTPSVAGLDGPYLQAYIERLLSYLSSYLRHGRVKEYRRRCQESIQPRGRIDVGRTARQYARGRRPLLSVRRTELSADIRPNRLLGMALDFVESSFWEGTASRDLVDRARSLAPLFDDVDRDVVRHLPRAARLQAFDECLRDYSGIEALAKALAYARAIVMGLGPSSEIGTVVPESFFLSLETLFEEAVREIAVRAGADLQVKKGQACGMHIFAHGGVQYRADPDIVLMRGDDVVGVLDCKYKVLEKKPHHEDLYQILAHSRAFGCESCALIYPGDNLRVTRLGTAIDGVSVFCCEVRLLSLEADVCSVVGEVLLRHG